ncbi:glycoside hydrolase family protein (plasmid) [Delftia tsuruhatensis]
MPWWIWPITLAYPHFKVLRWSALFNAGDQAGAAEQFPRWNKLGGKVLLGLRRRRAANRMRFQGSSGKEAIRVGAAIV